MIRVLFAASNPDDTDPLRLGKEIREIQSKLRSADNRQDFDLRSVWAVRPDDLLQQMNEFKPNILHFSGHGSSSGELVLEDSEGYAKPVPAEALETLFANFGRWLQVVVLNACYSEYQAKALSNYIDIIIGIKDSIDDEAAILFVSSFYRGLGFGRSVQDSFSQGLISLQLEDIGDEDRPTLLHRHGIDPTKLIIVGPTNTAEAARRANDAMVPQRLRDLLNSGSELLVVPSMEGLNASVDEANLIFLELAMRHSAAVFIVQVDRRTTIHSAATELARMLVPSTTFENYDWSLVKEGQPLAGYHSFRISGLKSGDKVLLVGNHRMPMWAPGPSFSPRRPRGPEL